MDKLRSFDIDKFLFKFRYPLLVFLFGIIFLGLGVLFFKNKGGSVVGLSSTKVEVLNSTKESEGTLSEIVVEVSGQVEKPGVYKLPFGSRVEDALILSGGFSLSADRVWVEKSLNRAAKLSDGQKLYIPKKGENAAAPLRPSGSAQDFAGQGGGVVGEGLININTATFSQLDSLPGIGQVYGQSIIEHRPYSNIRELLSRGVLKTSVYEKIKDKISVY